MNHIMVIFEFHVIQERLLFTPISFEGWCWRRALGDERRVLRWTRASSGSWPMASHCSAEGYSPKQAWSRVGRISFRCTIEVPFQKACKRKDDVWFQERIFWILIIKESCQNEFKSKFQEWVDVYSPGRIKFVWIHWSLFAKERLVVEPFASFVRNLVKAYPMLTAIVQGHNVYCNNLVNRNINSVDLACGGGSSIDYAFSYNDNSIRIKHKWMELEDETVRNLLVCQWIHPQDFFEEHVQIGQIHQLIVIDLVKANVSVLFCK